jgi:hypothetical protein
MFYSLKPTEYTRISFVMLAALPFIRFICNFYPQCVYRLCACVKSLNNLMHSAIHLDSILRYMIRLPDAQMHAHSTVSLSAEHKTKFSFDDIYITEGKPRRLQREQNIIFMNFYDLSLMHIQIVII